MARKIRYSPPENKRALIKNISLEYVFCCPCTVCNETFPHRTPFTGSWGVIARDAGKGKTIFAVGMAHSAAICKQTAKIDELVDRGLSFYALVNSQYILILC